MLKLRFFLLSLIPFLFAMSFPEKEIFQVMTAHPEILERLLPHIETVKKQNRLWLVKVTGSSYWKELPDVLRPVNGMDVRTYQVDSRLTQGTPDSEILQSLSLLNQTKIQEDIVWLASFKDRSASSAHNREAYEQIFKRLQNFGFQVSSVCYKPEVCSVVADLKGQSTPDQVLMVMGHLDSVGKNFAGADDNASGTAVALEMARVLALSSHRKTIRIFITNGEENGLLGATHYAQKLENEGLINNIVSAINMDMVSYNQNGIVELETNPEFENLAQQYATLASTYTTLKSKITLGAWGSDHVPFLKRKVSTMLTIEDWETKTPCYHQACDLPETLNYGYALEIAKLNLSAILSFDRF